MATIANMLNRVNSVQIEEIIQQSVEQTKDFIPQFNQDQLSVGLLATSNPIIPPYSPGYAKKKGFTTPDLFVTGAFYKGIFTTVDKGGFTTNSSDEKALVLESKYSKFIYGMTKESKSEYSLKTLRPVLNENLRKALQL